MNTSAIRPIETVAYGRRFRSRLEARYAVFLTHLGVRWEYEPEGFRLPSGWYLPDFYLPDVEGGTWLEIKPHRKGGNGWGCYSGERREVENYWNDPRMGEFQLLNAKFFIANGLPDPATITARACSYRYVCEYEDPGLLDAGWDPHFWCVCGCRRTVGIEFDGRGDRVSCRHSDCTRSSHGDKGYSSGHPRIIAAATKAHSARFEHEEAPD